MDQAELSKKFLRIIPNSMGLIRSHIRKASESELSFSKFRILAGINRGLKTVGDLAEFQCISQPAISKLVDSLTCENYLTRHTNSMDRRVCELQLTKEGRRKFQKVKNDASKDFQPCLDILNERELLELSHALNTLELFFEKIQEKKC